MDIRNFLKDNKIKVTKARIVILEILKQNVNAISVEYIYEECKKNKTPIDLSTIYRSLELLYSKNLINKFDLGHGKYNYIIKNDDHKHVIKCKQCSKEIEIDCPMKQIEQIIKNNTGFTITDNEIELKLTGICEECSNHK